ncbi:hypothetical protein QE361_000117 [Sphingomonas sp. SORGH_AS802]|uniref:hypothetical protein n=1 Tax=unclassified Sphingomonas TaxID=196159 RepID=UPI00285E4D2B|nr:MULTISPECIES: hypothetical protein [unclassified Sphingomonas]MDR6127931.1 hypothetical protein [Sphingomonas sp. SORGH_AS_0438]MDR6133159.1 hypothetical protein [Sphingomonas sp. SORGH_AS_0802]
MKVINDVMQLQSILPENTSKIILGKISSSFDQNDIDVFQALFSELFGGPIFLIETHEDLAEVFSLETSEDRRLSMLEAASGWFDIAQWVDDRRFAWFVIIEGNSGGPQYLIPRMIADQEPNVTASIRLTAERLSQ